MMSNILGNATSFCSVVALTAALSAVQMTAAAAQDAVEDESLSVLDEPELPENFETLRTADVEPFFLDQVAPGFLAADGVLDSPTPDVVMTIRGGVQVSPAYFGSDDLETGPNGSLRFDYVKFPGGFEFGSGQTVGFRRGLGLQGSVRSISKRDSSEYSEIDGLDDVDWSFEAGLGLGYEQRTYRLFANARYGFIGHNSWAGELGADGIAYPVEGLTLTFGPRVSLGDDRFTDTYFGVSESESAASGLEAYDPDGGVVGVGVVFGARYLWNERWGIEGAARYDRLTNDAADSPITETGSPDQYTFTIGITRRISLDF
ncbi:MipA/OmpV family protein [Amaricoccus macauensis]|uniref:MipA/OmpV family protein n=1 Tax=Amaricoccus macauensis TaxID=57001 RepID=UPI003C7C0608